MLRLLGNLSWTGTYAYTREQVEQIFTALQSELIKDKLRFLHEQESSKKRFSLSEPYDAEEPKLAHKHMIAVPLPDGTYLRAVGYPDFDYPCINIYWDNGINEPTEPLCFVELIQYVGGNATMIRRCIPTDANSSRSLDMDLCRALLKHVLRLDWKHEFVTKDALWILGHWPESMKLPEVDENLIYIDAKIIDCRKLMPKDAFIEKLFDDGGTFTALTDLCEEYESSFGTSLYWMRPYTDGLYNGGYSILVQEGILALSYDAIDWEDHEQFERESARLCSYEEMYDFAHEFQLRTTEMINTLTEMINTLNSMLFFLERKEELINAYA